MKRTLLIAALFASVTVPAIAADLPVRPPAPAPVMVPYLNWSGFYIGLNGGYSWGHSSRDLNFFNPLNGVTIATGTGSGRDLNGGVFGGQIGYNWQAANWVFGIEADAQWTGQKGGTTVLCPVGGCFPTVLAAVPANAASATLNDKLDWFATFRGRVGVLVTPGVLLYGTGGAAWGEVETDLTLNSFTATGVPISIGSSRSTNRFGWTLGAGIETMFSQNWSAKIEYLYLDMGTVSNSVVLPTAAGFALGTNVSSRITDSIIRGGINYHF